jgi:hypothetical protein
MGKDTQRLKDALAKYAAEHEQLTSPNPATPPVPDLQAMSEAVRREFFQDIEEARQRPQTRAKNPSRFEWLAWWRGLSLKMALPATAILLVGLLVWSSLNPAGSVMTVDAGERAGNPAGEPVLPRQLRVNFQKQTIEFFGDGDKLTGGLTELAAESTAEIAAFRVSAKGKDSTGLEATFEGRALATRAVASGLVRDKSDLKKLTVQGDLRITGAGSFPVKSTYLP